MSSSINAMKRFINVRMNERTQNQITKIIKLPLSSYKSSRWKTLKLPLVTEFNPDDLVHIYSDLNEETVLIVRGGITFEILSKSKCSSKIGVDFIDPSSAKTLFHISRGNSRGLNDVLIAKPSSINETYCNFSPDSDKKIPRTMELRKSTDGKIYTFSKRKDDNTFEVFMRCENPSVAAFLICCTDPTCCGHFVFEFYAMSNSSNKKQLMMIRDLGLDTVEYGPDLSLEEAVFVAYAIDLLTFRVVDPITKQKNDELWKAAARICNVH